MERYAIPYPMIVGPGSLQHLGELCSKTKIQRPLIVTDKGIEAAGILALAQNALGELANSSAVFLDVSPNPKEEDVTSALTLYRESGCDGLIALGGGSPIDAAKAIKLMATHEGTICDYDFLKGGLKKINKAMPPMLAVPTTSGTGSEVSRGSLVVTQRGDIKRKTLLASPNLVPDWSILDAKLTLKLPYGLTAATGIDALTHCIEELISPREHPTIEAIATGGIRRIAKDLPLVLQEPENIQARQDMQVSAMMGGIGFEKGLGVIHSLSHAIGALHPIHHGLLNGVLLTHALRFNREHISPSALSLLLSSLGLAPDADLSAGIDWIEGHIENWKIPTTLRSLSIPEEDKEEILARSLDDHCHLTNPRPCKPEDFEELWEMAW